MLMTSLFDKYRAEHTFCGGDPENVTSYTSQNLGRKIQDKFGNQSRIQLADKRRGIYISNASLSEEQSKTQLYDNAKEYEKNEKL